MKKIKIEYHAGRNSGARWDDKLICFFHARLTRPCPFPIMENEHGRVPSPREFMIKFMLVKIMGQSEEGWRYS